MLMEKKICFIGAGAMAEAVVAGLLNKKIVKPGQISIINKEDRFRLDELTYNFGVITDSEQRENSVRNADILVLAMKPKDVSDAVKSIRHLITPHQLFISVVAGISTDLISQLLGHSAPVIRTMPNTSAAVGLSATGICAGSTANEEHIETARKIFESIGLVLLTEEDKLDAVTGLSGSGPAYVYYLVESMLQGGQDVGLSEEEAKTLVLQVLLGSAQMLLHTGEDPSLLREKVTSPNGTTQAGLNVLRSFQFEEAVRQCIQSATHRSKGFSPL